MEEQFLSRKLSQKLKSLGFNEKCIGYYHSNEVSFYKEPWGDNTNSNEKLYHSDCTAPLIQQARDFLREKYNKFPVVFSDGFKWTYDLRWPDLTELDNKYPGVMFPKIEAEREYFDTYNEAELKAIEKIIEIEENESKAY